MEDVEYFHYSLSGGKPVTDDMVIGIRLTLNNRSSRALVINRVSLISQDGEGFNCAVDSHLFFGRESSKGPNVQVRSDPLPVNIAPYQGRRLLMFFRYPPISIQKLSLADPISLSAVSRGEYEPGTDTPPIEMTLEIHTDRRAVRRRAVVKHVAAGKIYSEAQVKALLS